MRVQAFITSGILEKYVLEMAPEEEVKEVLDMASQHLEIKEELSAIRKTMKGYILSHQVAPPPSLKEKVLTIGNRQSASMARTESHSKASSYSSPKKQKEGKGNGFFGIATVLLGLALLAACFTAYTFFKDFENAKNETAVALEEVEKLKKQMGSEQKKAQDLQAQLSFFHNRDNSIFLLNGNYRSPNSKATIYWNSESKSASIDLPNLPELTNGTVAVLWASDDRRSYNIGALAANAPGERSTLTFVENPTLFFVTEEVSADVDKPNRSKILMTGN